MFLDMKLLRYLEEERATYKGKCHTILSIEERCDHHR